jgi:diguanylate cyclase (GGDEF)-like protein
MSMLDGKSELREVHWLMDMLQSIDVGLMVVDSQYRLTLWNSFMQNHSNRRPKSVLAQALWDAFPEISEDWFRRKVDSVRTLRTPAFTTWEQRPYLLRFPSYRPITGAARFMYQNVTFMPLTSADGEVNHVGIIIYDVTDVAVNRADLEAANAQLEALSRTDELTGLNNRGYWEQRLQEEFNRYCRVGSVASLLLFDIDHFKRVNDTYGHPAGDEVIRQVAAVTKQSTRVTDICGRYGGEEFAVLLINTSAEQSLVFAERLRQAVSGMAIETDAGTLSVTISLGIAELSSAITNHERWIALSDQALYRAKQGGRNRTEVAVPAASGESS